MNVMSDGLGKVSGGKLESSLKKLSSNKLKALLLGAGITIAVQSSSAVTVMLVGLVNSGIMNLSQTIGVIMGSNIGTTLTAWITALSGLDANNNFLLRFMKPESFAPLIAFAGIVITMFAKKQKKKDIGEIMLGFAILMTGMELMGGSVEWIKNTPGVENVLVMFDNPLFGVFIGALVTGIIQSSAASVAMLQTLAGTIGLTFGQALPIIMGQNIGTCVTALISSIGVNKNAKKVSVVHILFNVIGTLVCLLGFYGLNAVFKFAIVNAQVDEFKIALTHTIFNVLTTLLLLPFGKGLEKIANLIIKTDDEKQKTTFIDERLLATPSVAVEECKNKTVAMGGFAGEAINKVIPLINKYDSKIAEEVTALEDRIDKYEDKLGTVLVKLSSKELSENDSKTVSLCLHTIGDFERLGDHAVNLLKVAEEINEKGIEFSDKAKAELKIASEALIEILDITHRAYNENNLELAHRVEPLEEVMDDITNKIKSNHINRLQAGDCTIELGFILSDLLTNYERISDHCSNIAVALIEVDQNKFVAHQYLRELKASHEEQFEKFYHDYSQKYAIE
jgi:phosphate:Na+ symporter